tara:strand:- start:56 stop:1222 length:1167 start_codon:yes stop_codon:yes gene_type:complete
MWMHALVTSTSMKLLLLLAQCTVSVARAPPCSIGALPFDDDWLRSELEPFARTFARRPSLRNSGGTGFFHAFYLWAAVRWLKPLHIVESGAYEGLGTWILRQAAPQAQIIVLTPGMPTLFRDRRADSRYFTDAAFKDFSDVDWECLGINKKRTLVFFDDHQAGYRRMLEAHARGFEHLLFDDNYPRGGDNFTPSKSCDAMRGIGAPFKFNDFLVSWKLGQSDLSAIGQSFARVTEVYQPFPLIWDGQSRLLPLKDFLNSTAPPLLSASAAAAFQSRHARVLGGADVETRKYTFLPYVKLRSEVPSKELYWPPQVTGSLGKKVRLHGGLQRSPAPKAYSSPRELAPRTANCQGAPLPTRDSTKPKGEAIGLRSLRDAVIDAVRSRIGRE